MVQAPIEFTPEPDRITPPGQVSYLDTLEPDISKAAKRFIESGQADIVDRTKTTGFVVWPYNLKTEPTVYCKALDFCKIQLEAGEYILEKNAFYLADEERWLAFPLQYGEGDQVVQTLLLKPKDTLPYLKTTVSFGTNRRMYTVTAVSGAKTTKLLQFWYPESIVKQLNAMAVAHHANAKTIAAHGLQVDLHSIHTNYKITCNGARFCPSFVGDDGQRTFILLPSGLEALGLPALLIERSGEQMIPNVRFDSLPWITVDGLFDRAQIRYGADKHQPVVDITRAA
jgi:P-type conjugative transfer protein TrbG